MDSVSNARVLSCERHNLRVRSHTDSFNHIFTLGTKGLNLSSSSLEVHENTPSGDYCLKIAP